MKKFQTELVGSIVTGVSVRPWNDLRMELDHGLVVVECLIANAYPHYSQEQEQWVLFKRTLAHHGAFLTVYNKRVEFIPPQISPNSYSKPP